MIDPDRGTGRTSAQMRNAPRDAVFVWSNERLDYPRAIARVHEVNREDLQIVAPSWLERGWLGRRLTGIVIDHDLRLSEKQWRQLEEARARIREPA
jgi:hypothetical protein